MSRIGGVTLAGSGRHRRLSWREIPYASLDFETTGLDPSRDAVVSYGVVPVRSGRVRIDEGVYRVVDPGVQVSPKAVTVHGIRPADQAGAPRIAEVAGELRGALSRSVVVAWTSWVEAAFLARSLGGRVRAWERHIVDVRRLAAWVGLTEAGRWNGEATLEETAERFEVPFDRAHHALWDAFVTAELFVVLATRMERRDQGEAGRIMWAGRTGPGLQPPATRASRTRP